MTTPDDLPTDARHTDGHPGELLDAWLDDRLDAETRRRVDEHLATCERCRREVDVLRATVEAVRTGLATPSVPEGLAARVGAALDAEDARAEAAEESAAGSAAAPTVPDDDAPTRSAGPAAPRPSVAPPAVSPMPSRRRAAAPRWRWLAVAAAVVAAVASLYWLLPGPPPGPDVATGPPPETDLVGDFAAAYAELDRGPLPAAFATTDPAEVEDRWQRAGLGFRTRVFDLEAMGIHLSGGGATMVGGRRAAVTAYRGADAGLLLCWMFEGSADDLPAGAEVRRQNGFEFHVYRRGERTLVFWQEGDVLCALAGQGDPEDVVALAAAKAMAPTASSSEDRGT